MGTLGEMNCGKCVFFFPPNYLSRWEFEPHLSASQAWRHVGREEGPSVSPAPLGRQPARSSTKSLRFISPRLTLRLCLLGSCCVDSPSSSAQGGPLFPGTPQAGSEGPSRTINPVLCAPVSQGAGFDDRHWPVEVTG